jgi:hypothetical protein
MGEKIEIEKLRTDCGTQPRESMSQDVIDEYAEAMKNGAKFPPIRVYADGTDYILADGFHRVYAARQSGIKKLAAEIIVGTVRDAILYSLGANGKHGLRRSNADKRRAVMRMLDDQVWQRWSDGAIAEKCGVSQPFVSNLRKESGHNGYDLPRKGSDGKTYPAAKTTPPISPELRGDPECENCRQPTKTRGLSMISKKWLCVDCIQREIQANQARPVPVGIDPDALYLFLPAYLAPDKRAHYCKCTAPDEGAAWSRARILSPSLSVQRGIEFSKPATAHPDIWIANAYDEFCALLEDSHQVDEPPAPPKKSILGEKYPNPARCKKCNVVSDDWYAVEMGVGAMRAQGWECPSCKAHFLNQDMLPVKPPSAADIKAGEIHDADVERQKKVRSQLDPGKFYVFDHKRKVVIDGNWHDQREAQQMYLDRERYTVAGASFFHQHDDYKITTHAEYTYYTPALQTPEQDESNDQLHEMAIAQLEALDKALFFINEHPEFMLGVLDEWIEAHPGFDWRMEVEDLISIVGTQAAVEQ